MGYEKYLKVREDAIKELKNYATRSNDNESNKYKISLCAYCMLDHDADDVRKVVDKISRDLSFLTFLVGSETYKSIVDECERDGSVSFCGWEYSRETPDTDFDSFKNYVLQELVTMSMVVKTPNYFENADYFCQKEKIIKDLVDDFCSCCIENTNFEIIGKLKDMGIVDKKDDEDDEDDGLCYYNNACPDELDTQGTQDTRGTQGTQDNQGTQGNGLNDGGNESECGCLLNTCNDSKTNVSSTKQLFGDISSSASKSVDWIKNE